MSRFVVRSAGVGLLASAVVVSGLSAVNVVPAAAAAGRGAAVAAKPQIVREVTAPQASLRVERGNGSVVSRPAGSRFPQAARTTVDVPAGGLVPVGATEVAVGELRSDRRSRSYRPGRAVVQVLDRVQAQQLIEGDDSAAMAVRVDAPTGTAAVTVEVDYSEFAEAYGAGYGSRLQLYSVPACHAMRPEALECRPVALPVDRDSRSEVLRGVVPVEPRTVDIGATAPGA